MNRCIGNESFTRFYFTANTVEWVRDGERRIEAKVEKNGREKDKNGEEIGENFK